MSKKNFLGKLLSSSGEASIRRFIALVLLVPYVFGIIVGIISSSFNFYITAMLCAGVPIMIAFFVLTWQNVSDIVKNLRFGNSDGDDEIPLSEDKLPPIE